MWSLARREDEEALLHEPSHTARAGALALTSLVTPPAARAAAPSGRPPIHDQIRAWMTSRRCSPQTASTFFFDGSSMRPPYLETVAIDGLEGRRGLLHREGSGRAVRCLDPRDQGRSRCLERGRQRYTISFASRGQRRPGDGKGILFQRGNVPTASFHVREDPQVPDRARGLRRHHERDGADARVPLADSPCGTRWAIIDYVRELEAQAAGKRDKRPRANK